MNQAARSQQRRILQDPQLVQGVFSDVRIAWVWLVVRVYVGWVWLIEGWSKVEESNQIAGISQTLIGIALIIGFMTGASLFAGTVLSVGLMEVGAISVNPVVIGLAILLMLAWKTAGWIGLDRWLLPVLGAPWTNEKARQPRERRRLLITPTNATK